MIIDSEIIKNFNLSDSEISIVNQCFLIVIREMTKEFDKENNYDRENMLYVLEKNKGYKLEMFK